VLTQVALLQTKDRGSSEKYGKKEPDTTR